MRQAREFTRLLSHLSLRAIQWRKLNLYETPSCRASGPAVALSFQDPGDCVGRPFFIAVPRVVHIWRGAPCNAK